MSDVQNYILTVNNDQSKADGYAARTASALANRTTTLVEVVQSLGEYINVEDATIRSRAINYLSEIISRLPRTFLTRQQTQVLCEFLCNRIEDAGSIAGLNILEGKDKYNKEMAAMTFRALIENFQDLQNRPQPQRLQVLSFLSSLMSGYREAISRLGSEAVVGISDLVVGEKDPRNLMVVFSILKVVIAEWDIMEHTEMLFDAVFCYFPITFRPPPDDPYGITAQDLKTRLRECVAASGLLAPYAFRQLIDKLDSTSTNVKRDVLQTITACLSNYGANTVSDHSIAIWDSLKFEILNMEEEELAAEAISALQTIARRLSYDIQSPEPNRRVVNYLEPVTRECIEQLREPTHKQAKPVGRILSALATASLAAFVQIIKATLPPLETLYHAADSIPKQRALLEVLVQLLESAVAIFGTHNAPILPLGAENPLELFKDRIFALSSQALMSTIAEEMSFRIVALRVLLKTCQIRSFLQDNEIGMFVQYLNDIVLAQDTDHQDNLKKEAILALVEISKMRPRLILEITLPAFMSTLPDSSVSPNEDYIIALEGLAQLSIERFVSDTLIRRLLNKLDVVLQSDGLASYSQAIMFTLDYMLSQRSWQHDDSLSYYHERIIVRLFRQVALSATGKEPTTALNETLSLQYLGRLAIRVVKALDTHRQSSSAMQMYSLFADDIDFKPVPFDGQMPTKQKRATMILSTSILAGVKPTVMPQFADAENKQNLVTDLVRLALIEDIPVIRQTFLRQIALLINKFGGAEDTQYALDTLDRLLNDLNHTAGSAGNAVLVIFWIAKALISRLSNVNEIMGRLLGLLSHNDHGKQSSHCFEIILAQDEIFSKENGVTIRLLARQRIFNVCIPSISQQFRSTSTSMKSNYLIALSGLLKSLPTDIFMPEIESLLPLLLQSLELDDSDVKQATIQNLIVVSLESPIVIEGHIGSLVERLLRAANDSVAGSAKIRYSALECLRSFPGNVKDSSLLPYKNPVTRSLMPVLDDPKRRVRKAAVECRAKWFKMDDPQSD